LALLGAAILPVSIIAISAAAAMAIANGSTGKTLAERAAAERGGAPMRAPNGVPIFRNSGTPMITNGTPMLPPVTVKSTWKMGRDAYSALNTELYFQSKNTAPNSRVTGRNK
jgi:hypothetical protein